MKPGQQGLLVFLACVLLLPAVDAREEILSFDADIQVRSDGSMQVTELIRVRAEGDQIRRGIYRDFPTDYRDRLNNRIQVGFQVIKVLRDGQSEAYRAEQQANGVRVYVGQADRILPPGEYSYAITYRTTRQLGFFADFDELYWNVTGNGWAFPILSATATVKLPPGVASSAMAIEGYTGPFGAQGQAYVGQIARDSEAFIRTTAPLSPGEGLTLVLSWPKGVVSEPTSADKVGFLLTDNRGLFIAGVGFGLMFIYLYWVWSRYGRDPEPGPVFPHYEPPTRLSPGACRYVLQMEHDNQAFAAAVLSLAVKGYLKIHEGRTAALEAATGESVYDQAIDQLSPTAKKWLSPLLELAEKAMEAALDDTFVLEQVSPVRGLPATGPGEKALLKKLFAEGQYLVLTNSQHEIVGAAIRAHEKALRRYYQRVNFVTNMGLMIPAILIGIATILAVGAFANFSPLVALVITVGVVVIMRFSGWMKAPTLKGRKLMDRLEGFKMYLAVAEADDLQRVEGIAGRAPRQTPELYERYLPFAVALDVEQPWADQFESLFTRIAAGQTDNYQPGWYTGSGLKPGSSFGNFSTALSSSLSSAISSSSTPPGSSSGGGGGGSSGGGGGGGGGGGW
ncbi:MAG: DUF2207 domain-containing protein [Gammaproteobacteria bacterium]